MDAWIVVSGYFYCFYECLFFFIDSLYFCCRCRCCCPQYLSSGFYHTSSYALFVLGVCNMYMCVWFFFWPILSSLLFDTVICFFSSIPSLNVHWPPHTFGMFGCVYSIFSFLFFSLHWIMVGFCCYISSIVRACPKYLGGKFALVERMKKQTDPIIVVMLLNVCLTLFVYRIACGLYSYFPSVFYTFSFTHFIDTHTHTHSIRRNWSTPLVVVRSSYFGFGPFALHMNRLELVVVLLKSCRCSGISTHTHTLTHRYTLFEMAFLTVRLKCQWKFLFGPLSFDC